jgi:hypothetical protein
VTLDELDWKLGGVAFATNFGRVFQIVHVLRRGDEPTGAYRVWIRSGWKADPPDLERVEVDALTAQCLLNEFMARPAPWWGKLWRYLWR